jgi:hypothetical protein
MAWLCQRAASRRKESNRLEKANFSYWDTEGDICGILGANRNKYHPKILEVRKKP